MSESNGNNSSPHNIVMAMRPSQWTKNIIVLAAFFFAFGDKARMIDLDSFWISLLAAGIFCLVSSGVYLLNDIRDINLDRMHPTKRYRPIAAGKVSVPFAFTTALLLLAIGLTSAYLISSGFFTVLLSYFVLQVLYTIILKKIALIDIMVIALGFVIRALSGAVVLGVAISPWLLVCTLLLALFLGLCKRRHEKVILNDLDHQQRPSLYKYDEKLLDQLIAIISAATIVCYAIYALWPATVEKFGTNALVLTLPFVIFGVFRYLDLVYRHEKGDRPERILLTDAPLLADMALYGICVAVIFALTRYYPQTIINILAVPHMP